MIVQVWTHPAKSGQLSHCSDLSTDWMIRESGIDLQREHRSVFSLHLANRFLSNPHRAVSPNVCSRPLTSIYWRRFSNGGVILAFPLRLAVFSHSSATVLVLVTSCLPSCSLTQQKLTKVLVCVTALLFLERTWWLLLRVPEEIRECSWSVEDARWAHFSLQATKCAAGILTDPSVYPFAVAKRQLRPPYIYSVAMNDVEKKAFLSLLGLPVPRTFRDVHKSHNCDSNSH